MNSRGEKRSCQASKITVIRGGRIVSVTHGQKQSHYDVLTIGIYLLAGAIVALGLANLPAWTGSLLAALNVLPAHLT